MSRVIVVALVSGALGAAVAAGVVLNRESLYMRPEPRSSLAVVDLAGIVDRQRAVVIREAKDPDAAESMMTGRMLRLAGILAEAGQTRVILNKPAVVSGTVTDVTAEIEERLTREGSEARGPSR